jgi:hypothetical protein
MVRCLEDREIGRTPEFRFEREAFEDGGDEDEVLSSLEHGLYILFLLVDTQALYVCVLLFLFLISFLFLNQCSVREVLILNGWWRTWWGQMAWRWWLACFGLRPDETLMVFMVSEIIDQDPSSHLFRQNHGFFREGRTHIMLFDATTLDQKRNTFILTVLQVLIF